MVTAFDFFAHWCACSLQVAVAAAGDAKAVAFGRIHHTRTPPDFTLPGLRVKLPSNEVIWFVDAGITRTMEDDVDRSRK